MPESPTKVVIIDDEPEIIELVQLILKRKGFELIGAVGGEAGLQVLKQVKPDLVMLDLMMSEGPEIYRRIIDTLLNLYNPQRQQEDSIPQPRKKVVCITGKSRATDLLLPILELEQFIIIKVEGGQKGLDRLKQIRPDLVLVDPTLPDMRYGWEVYQRMKADEEMPEIPVIIVIAPGQSKIDKVLK